MSYYYGETRCSSICGNDKQCSNKAYYRVDDTLYCGVHSRNKKNRIVLIFQKYLTPPNPPRWGSLTELL